MFDNLLNRYNPFATVYNTLIVVKSAFRQFDVNKHCCSEEIHQIEPSQVAFIYDPYADIHQEDLFTSDSEDGFILVTCMMENDMGTDYCLVETQSGKSSAAAIAIDDAATAVDLPAITSPAFYVSLVDSAYNLASVLAAHVACNIIYEALLSCNLSWNEEKPERPAGAATEPKMKGFGATFAMKLDVNETSSASDTIQTEMKGCAVDVAQRKNLCVGIDMSIGTTASVSDFSSPSTQPEMKGIAAEHAVKLDANTSISNDLAALDTAQSEIKCFDIGVDTKIGMNTIPSPSAATLTTTQPEIKGFGADMNMNFNVNSASSASTANSDSTQPATKSLGAHVGTKVAGNSTAFTPDSTADAAQPDLKGLGVDIGVNIDMNTTSSAASIAASDPSPTKTRRFGIDIGMEFDANSATFASDLKSDPAQKEWNGFGTGIGMTIGLSSTSSTTALPSESVQTRLKGFGADFDINFKLNTIASALFGFSTTVSTPAALSTPAQLKTRRVGADLGVQFGFTAFKKYFKSNTNAANNYSTTDYSDNTWEIVEKEHALNFESN